jgi:alkanesulfonate monooxygenase SsuD/methylene tetrahydromethanopterin reductase-like flavin-dependent oxidoreductase (luciferase family)
VRLRMLEEQVEIVHREWRESDLTFEGEHYGLRDLDALPKPVSLPNLIIGGRARRRSVALAVRWADEYNLVMMGLDEARERSGTLVKACESAGRDRLTISLMTGSLIGADEADLADRARRLAELRREDAGDVAGYIAGLPDNWIVGTLEEVREQLADLEEAGVERVMLQHLLHRDLDGVALIGELAAS